MRYLFPLFLIFFLTSCKVYNLKTTVQIDTLNSPDISKLRETRYKLIERLNAAELEKHLIKSNKDSTLLTIFVKIDLKDEMKLKQLSNALEYTSVGFWNTYLISDTMIKNIKDDLPVVDGFTPRWELDNDVFRRLGQREVLGTSTQVDSLESIKFQLEKNLREYDHLRLYWSAKPKDVFRPNEVLKLYQLFMIDTRGEERPPIFNQHITKSSAGENIFSTNVEINISLTDDGAKKLYDLTHQAAANNNRPIAIVIEDRVYATPSVAAEIKNGESAILGDFTIYDAKEISNKIMKSISLPLPIKVLDVEIRE